MATITPPAFTGQGVFASLEGRGSVGGPDLLAAGGISQFVNSQHPFAWANPRILAMPVVRSDMGILYLVRNVGSVRGSVPADERSSTLLRRRSESLPEGDAVMRAESSTTNALAVFAASSMLLICGAVSAQTIIPLDQQRSVNTFLIVPQCLDKTFDEDSAKGFGPFDGVVETLLGCDSGFGSGSASQQSQIGASSMTGSGSGTSEALGPVPDVIHAFGYSYFEVTFELPSASNFALDGLISAVSSKDQFPFAGASISLRDSDLQLIFNHLVESGPGGEPNSLIIEDVGMLVPGVYTLQAQAGSFIDNDVPPSLSGEASFDFTFEVAAACPWDLDDSGDVGVKDLLFLLGAWGPCLPKEDCLADFDDSGDVGVKDLLDLLGNWGACV